MAVNYEVKSFMEQAHQFAFQFPLTTMNIFFTLIERLKVFNVLPTQLSFLIVVVIMIFRLMSLLFSINVSQLFVESL